MVDADSIAGQQPPAPSPGPLCLPVQGRGSWLLLWRTGCFCRNSWQVGSVGRGVPQPTAPGTVPGPFGYQAAVGRPWGWWDPSLPPHGAADPEDVQERPPPSHRETEARVGGVGCPCDAAFVCDRFSFSWVKQMSVRLPARAAWPSQAGGTGSERGQTLLAAHRSRERGVDGCWRSRPSPAQGPQGNGAEWEENLLECNCGGGGDTRGRRGLIAVWSAAPLRSH